MDYEKASFMQRIKTILFKIFVVVITIIFSIIGVLLLILPFSARWKIMILWAKLCVWGSKNILGIKYKILGLENIANHGAIYMSKHQSEWETFFLPTIFKRPSNYFLKKELMQIPLFGWGLKSAGHIGIDRTKGREAIQQILSKGQERLNKNLNIIIYPEGTRTYTGESGKYKKGGSLLAVKSGFGAIPIALNSGRVWSKNAKVIKSGVITVSIGPHIPADNLNAEEHLQKVEAWIENEMQRLNPEDYSI